MVASDKLFALIKSLTPSEKRYFTIFCGRHVIGESNNYLMLFKAVEGMESYDEQALKEDLDGTGLQKHFSSIKVKLYSLILKAMREYNTQKSLEIKVREMLDDAGFLLGKMLYQDCAEVLAKAKKLAYQAEDYGSVMKLLHLERLLIYATETKDLRGRFAKLEQESQELLELIDRLESSFSIYDKLYIQSHISHGQPDRSGLDAIIGAMPVSAEDQALSFGAKNNYLNGLMLYHRLLGDMESSVAYCKKVVDLWNSYPHMAENSPQRYIKAISNYCSLCLRMNRLDEFSLYLKRLEAVPVRSSDDEAERFRATSHLQLLYCLNTASFSEAAQLLEGIESGVRKYKEKIDSSRLLALYYNSCILFFLMQDYPRCLNWLNRIIDHKKLGLRQDIIEAAQLLLFVVHYELGNWSYLGSLYRNTLRYFKQKEKLQDFQELLKSLYCLAEINNEKDRLQSFDRIRDSIGNLRKTKQHIGLLELGFWLESGLTGQPLAGIFEAHVRGGRS